MRIVLTVHQFLPDHASGTEILTYETARELRRRGHAVAVFTAFPALRPVPDAERFDRYLHDGLPVERFHFTVGPMGDQTSPAELEFDNRLVGRYFAGYLERQRPDLVHFFHLSRLSASVVDACADRGIPMVFTPTDFWFRCPTHQLRLPDHRPCPGPDPRGINCARHLLGAGQSRPGRALLSVLPDAGLDLLGRLAETWGDLDRRYSPLLRALRRRQRFVAERLARIDRVAVPTEIMRSQLEAAGLEASRAVFVPFGINLAYLEGARRPPPGDRLRVGYIGTLYEHKGVHVLAQAIRRLAGRPVELDIYGRPDEYPAYVAGLRRIAGDDERIRFRGTFPNAQIGRILAGLDVLVVPSLWHENSPLVVQSAQAAGCPVIASDMAGLAEVIEHGGNGLLVPPGDVEALARAIDRVAGDRALLEALARRARRPPSIEAYADRLLEIYTGLLAGAPAR